MEDPRDLAKSLRADNFQEQCPVPNHDRSLFTLSPQGRPSYRVIRGERRPYKTVVCSNWRPGRKIPWVFEAVDPLKSSHLGLSGCSVGKNLPTNTGDARDAGVIPGSGRSPGVEHGNPLKDSCLENSMDRGAWWSMGLQRDPTERLSVCTSARARTHAHTHTHTHTHTDTQIHIDPQKTALWNQLETHQTLAHLREESGMRILNTFPMWFWRMWSMDHTLRNTPCPTSQMGKSRPGEEKSKDSKSHNESEAELAFWPIQGFFPPNSACPRTASRGC